MRAAIEASTRRPGAAWVLSNHDFGRLATRFGPENARAAALLLLTLPGPAFLYQGDEIGLGDGPRWPSRRAGSRTGATASATRCSGTARLAAASRTGEAWLRAGGPRAHQRRRPSATTRARPLSLVRDLLTVRRVLGDGFELLEAEPGVLAYRRGDHLVAINTTSGGGARAARWRARRSSPRRARGATRMLAANSGVITRLDEG